jgi:hypothetical protein
MTFPHPHSQLFLLFFISPKISRHAFLPYPYLNLLSSFSSPFIHFIKHPQPPNMSTSKPTERLNVRCPADYLSFIKTDKLTGERKIELPDSLPPRPKKANTLGREIKMGINTYNLHGLPTRPAYQYDVSGLLDMILPTS